MYIIYIFNIIYILVLLEIGRKATVFIFITGKHIKEWCELNLKKKVLDLMNIVQNEILTINSFNYTWSDKIYSPTHIIHPMILSASFLVPLFINMDFDPDFPNFADQYPYTERHIYPGQIKEILINTYFDKEHYTLGHILVKLALTTILYHNENPFSIDSEDISLYPISHKNWQICSIWILVSQEFIETFHIVWKQSSNFHEITHTPAIGVNEFASYTCGSPTKKEIIEAYCRMLTDILRLLWRLVENKKDFESFTPWCKEMQDAIEHYCILIERLEIVIKELDDFYHPRQFSSLNRRLQWLIEDPFKFRYIPKNSYFQG